MASRLERRERHKETKGLQLQSIGSQISVHQAEGNTTKKSTQGPLTEIISAWLARHQNGKTAKAVASEIRARIAEHKSEEVRPADIESIATRWQTECAKSTRMHYGRLLRNLCKDIEFRTGQPTVSNYIPRFREPRPRLRVLSLEEMNKLLDGAQGWMRNFVLIAVNTALRHAEILDLKEENFDGSIIRFKAKGGEMQEIPCNETVQRIIRNAPPLSMSNTEANGIISRYAGRKVNKAAVYNEWWKMKRRGVMPPDVNIHDLRRTVAVRAYELTHDLRTVEHILRHRSLQTTARYLEPFDPRLIKPILDELWTPRRNS